MRSTSALISLILLTLLQLIDGARKPESVLLSKVNTLTLRKDLKTTNNRVAAVPQVCDCQIDSIVSNCCQLTGLDS